MSDNFVIGSTPIPEENLCSLKFHQFTIYDSENWLQSGVLRWNATTKNFEVLPDPPGEKNVELLEEKVIPVASKKETSKIIIPKKNK